MKFCFLTDLQRVAWGVVFGAAVACPALGDVERPSGTPSANAAVWYLTGLEAGAADLDADQQAVLNDFRTAPLAKAADLLAALRTQMAYFRRGAACEFATWAVDVRRDGPGALLPHLGPMRRMMRQAVLRSRLSLDRGQPGAAVDDWVAALRMARHAADDGTTIGALVQFSIENEVVAVIAEHLHHLGRADLMRLRGGLKAVPPRRTIAQAVPSERAMVEWCELQVAKLGLDGAVARLRETGQGNEQIQAVVEAVVASDTPERLVAGWIDDADGWYDRVREISAADPSGQPDAIAAFETELAASDNRLVQALLPQLGAACRAENRCRVTRGMLDAALALRLDNAFDTVLNPLTGEPFIRRRADNTLFIGAGLALPGGVPLELPLDATVATPLSGE